MRGGGGGLIPHCPDSAQGGKKLLNGKRGNNVSSKEATGA